MFGLLAILYIIMRVAIIFLPVFYMYKRKIIFNEGLFKFLKCFCTIYVELLYPALC